MSTALVLLLVAMVAAFLWRSSMDAKESAVQICKSTCRSYDVQLLDDTVSLISIRPVRGRGRLISLRRVYGFEFSQHGVERRNGAITLLGGSLESIYMDSIDAPT